MSDSPFVIFALPRSRTTWLSQFLSYGGWHCGHEESRHFRSLDDLKNWLSQPMTGSAETAAAPFWRMLPKYRPDAKVVVVRRPVEDVVESLLRLDMHGSAQFDRDTLTRHMTRLDGKLGQIERRLPNVLSVQFPELGNEATAARVFEHCLPFAFVPSWWRKWRHVNVQCSMPALARYYAANRTAMDVMALNAGRAIIADMARKAPVLADGMTLQVEPFEDWLRDGQGLFAEHSGDVGEAPDSFASKNIPLMRALDQMGSMQIVTARSNGRMFGYLVSVLHPSLEAQNRLSAVHTTFYASKDAPGLGLKLQRAALGFLKERGVSELFMRAGPRGDGPRTGALYRRLGAADDGQIYRLSL